MQSVLCPEADRRCETGAGGRAALSTLLFPPLLHHAPLLLGSVQLFCLPEPCYFVLLLFTAERTSLPRPDIQARPLVPFVCVFPPHVRIRSLPAALQLAKLREESRSAADRLEESEAVQKVHAGKVIDLKREVSCR